MSVDIAKWRALLDVASPAPWERLDADGAPTPNVGYCIVSGGIERSHIAAEWRGDAALIVALRNDARELIIELERLRAEPLRLQADALMRALAATQKELAELAALQEETRALNVRQCDELERLRRFRDTVLDHDEDCGECAECASEDGGLHEDLARERAERALAKVKP